MTSSIPRGPCFTLTGNAVIDAVYYLTAAIKLATLLCGPLLLAWLLVPRAADRVDYVVPLTQSLRKTIYVKRVKTTGSEHQRHADPATRQFARFRQLVKNIPSEQIVDVRQYHLTAIVNLLHWLCPVLAIWLQYSPVILL